KPVKTDERFAAAVEHRPGYGDAADRIGPIEDDESLAMFGRRLHRFAHRRDVGIESSADVLDVEDDGVDGFEHRRRRPPRFAVEAIDLSARRLVLGIADLRNIELSLKADI